MRIGGDLPSGVEGDTEDYRPVGVPLTFRAAYPERVTASEKHPEHSEPGVDLQPASFDSLIADGAEVTRHLAEVPRQRAVTIPARAVALVADLDAYGD
jgi:hypothetical protein